MVPHSNSTEHKGYLELVWVATALSPSFFVKNSDIYPYVSFVSGRFTSFQNACGSPSKTISSASFPARRKAR